MTEVEKLLYENKRLANQLKDSQHCINVYSHTITELSKGNSELKEQNSAIKETNAMLWMQINRYSALTDSMIDKVKIAEKLIEQLSAHPLTPEQSIEKEEEVDPKVKPYYYTVSNSTCIENCKFNLRFHGFTIKIGSSACGECEYCKEIDYENDFVKCKLMPEGKEKVEPKKEEIKQKRDEFGIIGVTENIGVCKDCIYKEYSDKSRPCTHCRTKLNEDEYYISK